MEMRKLVVIYLFLDALVVVTIGILSFHGEHGWDFFFINAVRLGVMAGIVALWRPQTSKWLERVFIKHRYQG